MLHAPIRTGAPEASFARVPEPTAHSVAYTGAWVPWWEAPLIGRGKREDGRGKERDRQEERQPGIGLDPLDMDIAPDPLTCRTGNRYITSIEKFITA